MKKISKTRFSVLGILSIEPMSGYEIKKAMDQSTQYFWQESPGQIYPILATLLEENLVTVTEKRQTGKRVSNIYQITDKGLKAFKDWLKQDPMPSVPREELLLKLFFGVHNEKNINESFIKNQAYQLNQALKSLTEIKLRLEKEKSPHQPYWLMTIDFGVLHTQAELEWCENTLKQLKKLKT